MNHPNPFCRTNTESVFYWLIFSAFLAVWRGTVSYRLQPLQLTQLLFPWLGSYGCVIYQRRAEQLGLSTLAIVFSFHAHSLCLVVGTRHNAGYHHLSLFRSSASACMHHPCNFCHIKCDSLAF